MNIVNNKYKKIKNQIIKLTSKISKEVIKDILEKKKLKIGKIKIEDYLTLSLFIQEKQIKNLKKFYKEDLDFYVKNKPNYANFLRNLHNYGKIIKELLFHKIKQNLFITRQKEQEELLLFLDSTKLKLTEIHSITNFKGHKYNHWGKPSVGVSSTGRFFGYKATALITENNLLLALDIKTAKVHDSYFLNNIIHFVDNQILPKNIKILADKGYINKEAKEKLKKKQVALITPNRKNMKESNKEFQKNYKTYKKRQGIERYFKKL